MTHKSSLTMHCWIILVIGALTQVTSSQVLADSMKNYQIEEVIVTARKKLESAQDVPISIAAFNADSIRENGFSDTLSIDEKVPNLEIKTFGGQPNIFIRGVGNNDFNATTVSPVSIYFDDVVMGLTGSQISQVYDLERIRYCGDHKEPCLAGIRQGEQWYSIRTNRQRSFRPESVPPWGTMAARI